MQGPLGNDSRFDLDPQSALGYGKEFLPGEIAQLLDGAAAMTTHDVAESTSVLVGRPADKPPGMEGALRDRSEGMTPSTRLISAGKSYPAQVISATYW